MDVTSVTHCSVCGWPSSDPYEVLSRHMTSEGVITYSRCACGEVRFHLQVTGTTRLPGVGG
jgi:hypothetical protein